MSNRTRVIPIVLVTVIAALSGGAYAYWYFLLQSPLSGRTSHDFGDVALFSENEEVQHTFHLVNRQSKPVTIVAVKPECGCLTTRDVHETIQPGEAFDLPVTLIAKGGERVVPIRVLFDDDSMMTLKVQANGRYMPRLRMAPPQVALDSDGTAEFIVFLDTYESWDDPAAPTVTSGTEGVSGEFISWSLKFRPKDVIAAPTHWEGRVRVRFSGDANEIPADANLTVNWPPAKPLEVSLLKPGTVIQPDMPRLSIP